MGFEGHDDRVPVKKASKRALWWGLGVLAVIALTGILSFNAAVGYRNDAEAMDSIALSQLSAGTPEGRKAGLSAYKDATLSEAQYDNVREDIPTRFFTGGFGPINRRVDHNSFVKGGE